MDDFPRGEERPQTGLPRSFITGGVLLVAAFLILGAVDFTTEAMWFESLGARGVFFTSLTSRFALFVGGSLLFLLMFGASVAVARRLAYTANLRPRRAASTPWEELLAQVGTQVGAATNYRQAINLAVLAGGVFLALLMGLLAAGNWLPALLFLNRGSFGIADPAFGQDVAFYVFAMPVLRSVEGWLFVALLLIAISTAVVYAMVLTYELAVNLGQVRLPLSRGIQGHMLCLAALGLMLISAHHLLDMFDLVRSTRGATHGVSYTDYFAQRPAQIIMAVAAMFAAALCAASIATGGLRMAVAGAGLWSVSVIVAGWLAPAALQNLDVNPNELDRERPFIAANIQLTRQAFGLADIEERDVAFEEAVSPLAMQLERETINNIRLWDHRPLRETYKQIQAIRQYYNFHDVDVDRYVLDGEYRQVMVSARELAPDQLPSEAQSWVSRQLQYTHGYGVVMSPVNVISQEGLPELMIRDIPPVSKIPITRPEIYFGEQTNHYVITRTTTPEFDYPSGDQGVFLPRYLADSGISVGSLLNRFLFALRFQDPNFILNSSFRDDSQLLFRRNIRDRAQQLAPFLQLDDDPYIVVANGELYWIHDAYTTSDRYPYAQPYELPSTGPQLRRRGINYIRNSVKIVTNAYDGSIIFYVTDPNDPLIQSYRRIFPSLFASQDQAPPEIRAHFRYPEGLFRIQTAMFRNYHMQDPRVFYLREDVWAIPNELFYAQNQPIEPYYVIMKLPAEERPEFVLMLPFSPGNRPNMVGWLAARSDGDNYGKLLLYKYPKDKVIFGPSQLETRIDQDASISQQFSLWSQSGAQVIRGNLLVIPVGQSNLYVEPIYLQATASPLPELKRVIVATGSRIVMEPTLQEALTRLFGGGQERAAPGPSPTQGSPATSATVRQLAAEAQAQYRRAQDALRTGDFARYGEELRALEESLNRLVQVAGQ